MEGSVLNLLVKAGKRSDLVPDLEILGPDLAPIPGVDEAKQWKGNGRALKAKKLVLPATGLYYLVVRPKDGTIGAYQVKSALKAPKKLTLTGEIPDPGGEIVLEVPSPGQATGKVSVAAQRKWSDAEGPGNLMPTPGDVVTPGARVVMVRGTQGVTFADPTFVDETILLFDLDVSRLAVGRWHVDVENPDQGRGRLPAAFTVLNVSPKNLFMTPGEGTDGEVLSALITGEDFLGGTTVRLFRESEEIPGQGTVLVDGSTISTSFDLRGRAQGDWDLEVTNQGAAPTLLRNALRIVNAAPVITGITPDHCFDPDGEVDVVIPGRELDPGTEVELRLAGETPIGATSVSATSLQISCHLDLGGT